MQDVMFQQFKLGNLNPAEYNPRSISDESLSGLTNCLKKFGCVQPIVVNVRNGQNIIVGGHQRHSSLVGLHGNDYQVTCVVVDLSIEDEKLLNLSLNNPQIQGEFISSLDSYIDHLKAEISQDDFYDMKINTLQAQLETYTESIEIEMEREEVAGVSLNYLSFGKSKIPLSDEEMESLSLKFEAYLAENGSAYGFASSLLEGC